MKIAFALLLSVMTTVFAAGRQSPVYAKDGRIVTLEQWGRNEALVWAVQSDRIVAYKTFDTAAPDLLIVEVPITKELAEKIRACVSAIPHDAGGRVYAPRGVFDGVMLRISFTTDGHLSNDRIEVRNLWLPWLAGITQAISEVMPDKQKIRFKEQIEAQDSRLKWSTDWPTESITIEKYYEVPGQPSKPTASN